MLAWTLLQQNDTAAALPYAGKAAEHDPNSALAQYVFGRSLVNEGKVPEGIKYLEIAVKLDPQNLENHLALATAYSKDRRPLDARRERLESLEISQETQAIAQP